MKRRRIFYGKGSRNKSIVNAKTFVKNVKSSKKKNINNLPKYDANILISNLSLWKNKLKEIYGEELISQFESLFDKIELRKGTSGFTQFRNKKHENKTKPAIKPCENKNRENFGKSNIEDKKEWTTVDVNIKKDYKKNCLRKNHIFNLEFFLVNNLLFLGYDPIEKGFLCSAKNIFFVYVKLVVLKHLYEESEFNIDIENNIEQQWLKLTEGEKAFYYNKKAKLENLINEINSFDIPNVITLYKNDIKNNNDIKLSNKNYSYYLKQWKLLDDSIKEKYYQQKEKFIAINEIIININKIKNFEVINSPYQPSQLFIKDLKNNFIAYKNINIEKCDELWNECDQSIKQLYEEKYSRSIIEYNLIRIIKEKIKNHVVKILTGKINYNEIKLNYINKINNTINNTLSKQELKEKIYNLNEEQTRELNSIIRKARNNSKKNILDKIRFDISQKNFSEQIIFAKENATKVLPMLTSKINKANKNKKAELLIQEINEENTMEINNTIKSNDSTKSIMYHVSRLYNSLSEEEQIKYIGKKIFLNQLRQKRINQLEKNLYYEIDEYEWYFQKGFKNIPENPTYAKAILDEDIKLN